MSLFVRFKQKIVLSQMYYVVKADGKFARTRCDNNMVDLMLELVLILKGLCIL